MEDAIIAQKVRNWSLFAVLDGHGGSQCSQTVSRNFGKILNQEIGEKSENEMESVLLKTFERIDQEFCSNFENVGSTCTLVLITGKVKNVTNLKNLKIWKKNEN